MKPEWSPAPFLPAGKCFQSRACQSWHSMERAPIRAAAVSPSQCSHTRTLHTALGRERAAAVPELATHGTPAASGGHCPGPVGQRRGQLRLVGRRGRRPAIAAGPGASRRPRGVGARSRSVPGQLPQGRRGRAGRLGCSLARRSRPPRGATGGTVSVPPQCRVPPPAPSPRTFPEPPAHTAWGPPGPSRPAPGEGLPRGTGGGGAGQVPGTAPSQRGLRSLAGTGSPQQQQPQPDAGPGSPPHPRAPRQPPRREPAVAGARPRRADDPGDAKRGQKQPPGITRSPSATRPLPAPGKDETGPASPCTGTVGAAPSTAKEGPAGEAWLPQGCPGCPASARPLVLCAAEGRRRGLDLLLGSAPAPSAARRPAVPGSPRQGRRRLLPAPQ